MRRGLLKDCLSAARPSLVGVFILIAVLVSGFNPAALAQSDNSEGQVSLDDMRKVFDRLITASDKGERPAFVRFSRLYPSLYEQALYEASADVPKTATAMIPELDHWLLDRANAGSRTAQFWMGERGKVLQKYGAPVPDIAEVAKWYRASAEQGFAPAQDSLGQILGFFPELAREPFEAETWLYRAAAQGEGAAADRLLQAIEIDRARADYTPSDEVQAWLRQRAGAGDARAAAVLDQLGAKTQN